MLLTWQLSHVHNFLCYFWVEFDHLILSIVYVDGSFLLGLVNQVVHLWRIKRSNELVEELLVWQVPFEIIRQIGRYSLICFELSIHLSNRKLKIFRYSHCRKLICLQSLYCVIPHKLLTFFLPDKISFINLTGHFLKAGSKKCTKFYSKCINACLLCCVRTLYKSSLDLNLVLKSVTVWSLLFSILNLWKIAKVILLYAYVISNYSYIFDFKKNSKYSEQTVTF